MTRLHMRSSLLSFRTNTSENTFEPEFEVTPKPELQNAPHPVNLPDSVPNPAKGKLSPEQFKEFVEYTASIIAEMLDLKQLKREKRKR